ncbi:TPA: hypothetical protein ACN4VG_002341 [Staphylococcus aureus]
MAIFNSIMMCSFLIYCMILTVRFFIHFNTVSSINHFVTRKEYVKNVGQTLIRLIGTILIILLIYHFTVVESNPDATSKVKVDGVFMLGFILAIIVITALIDYTLIGLYRLLDKTLRIIGQRKDTVVNRFYKSIYRQDDKDIVEQFKLLQNSKHAKCTLTNEQALVLVSALIKHGENDIARKIANQFGHRKESKKYEPAFQIKEG